MNYTTGQRFTAKIGIGKIFYPELTIDQDKESGFWHLILPDGLLWFIGTGSDEDLKNYLVTDLILLPDTEFDKDNWVVDIEKEKDHPRLGEFKEWYDKKIDWECDYNLKYYGFSGDEIAWGNSLPVGTNVISLDTFFTHFCKETTDPKKGDLVEVSGDNVKWYSDKERIYTGFQDEQGWYLVFDKDKDANFWGYIRLAKSPEQAAREKAEKNPIDNVTVENLSAALKYFGYQTDPKMLDLIIDLVELLENKGSDTTINELVTLELERMGALTA